MNHRSSTNRFALALMALSAFVSVFCIAALAWADPGATELFVRDTTSVLRHLEASFEGAALQRGYTDRELHFSLSVPLGAIGCQLASVLLNQEHPRWQAALAGFAVGMAPGFAKEFIDMASPNNYFSWRDIGYDAAGVLTGVLIVWVINRVISKTKSTNTFSHY